jgi:argininosuccinate lyase
MKKRSRKMDYHTKGPGFGTRFSEPWAKEMIEYGSKSEISEARYVFHHELWNHRAHALMLYEQGIIARRHAAKILRVLSEIESMGIDRFPLDPKKGELFYNIESYLIGRIGEDPGGRMHTGRSRGDMYVCSERMILREKILQLIGDAIDLIEAIIDLSGRHVETIMPGYTLLQHAQPTTFAHYLLSFANRYQRDITRLQETYQRVNLSPMGAAISTGSGFPLNRPRMAELLGFGGVVRNTRDAAISRDFTLESITHAAILLSNLSALADDLNVWCTYEFGMIELSDAYCGTSTIMPQKKNPSSLERIRYLSAEGIGNTMTLFAQLKTHSEQLGDLEATGPVAWRTFDNAHGVLRLMRGVLSALKVKKDLMRQRAGANFAQSTQLADVIAQEKGMAFRTAHRIVGKLVKNCMDQHVTPDAITPEMLADAAIEITGKPLRMDPEKIKNALDVGHIIEHRHILGGPGRRQVLAMLKAGSSQIVKEKQWLQRQRERLQAARNLTDSLARKLRGQG